ncbi:p20 [Raspberry leaf mottle virus]|uniref:p20 n=1 Tax=Raspberry leaf mottle virus TaxID=326941 RepID=A0MBX1_9CLOS|nr:p20 [Raspberry leaf mottle virus]ABC87282.1 p20 [Raspberry leaf mottle virus]QRG29100.1 p20 [Raspberry leaf mottle virus]
MGALSVSEVVVPRDPYMFRILYFIRESCYGIFFLSDRSKSANLGVLENMAITDDEKYLLTDGSTFVSHLNVPLGEKYSVLRSIASGRRTHVADTSQLAKMCRPESVNRLGSSVKFFVRGQLKYVFTSPVSSDTPSRQLHFFYDDNVGAFSDGLHVGSVLSSLEYANFSSYDSVIIL